jgi:hypothetical protein
VKFPKFKTAQQRSTRCPHLIETKRIENRALRGSLESALGTVDRIISFNNLEVDHLPKQQVVASDDPHQGCIPVISLWNPRPQF